VDLGRDVFADHGYLPDEPPQFHLDAIHPHMAPQINDVSSVIIYAFTH
jgi:hypothetical protein